jgi:hypothetical protein
VTAVRSIKLPFFATASVVSALCCLVVWRGWEILQLSAVEATLGTQANRVEAFGPWLSVPGLAYSARQASFSGEVQASDTEGALQRSGELTDILSVTPMSSAHWLLLSAMRNVAREPLVWTVAALAMSNVTGANEGYMMPQRAIFALSLWENLPSDLRLGAANDLALSWKTFTDPRRIQLRNILAAKSDSVRADIRKSLTGSARLTTEDLVQLGLQVE